MFCYCMTLSDSYIQYPANSFNIIIHDMQINKTDTNFKHITNTNDLAFKLYAYYMEIYN